MPFLDLPPAMEERVICSVVAAVKYELPANIVLAVAGQEGGKPGQWVQNKNGTYDVGTMQFNTGYLADLAKYGITAQDVEKPGCYPYELAAWRIRGHVKNDQGDLWTRVANYHSRTPEHNQKYRALIMRRASEWANWLDKNFITHQVAQQSVIQPANSSVTSQVAAIEPKAVSTPVEEAQPQAVAARKYTLAQADYTPRQIAVKPQSETN
ncbi:muramidase [Pseudomonas aeruginosa]|uniref:muramidase n=1 Tax=Pseudomonas aeruginosa TaxID=287 RepID=UPI003983ACE4